MSCARIIHIIFCSFFLLKGLALVLLGVAAIGFAEDIDFLNYVTSADQTQYDSIGGIAFFLSRHFGPVSLTVGLVTLLLAVFGIVVSTRKDNSPMVGLCTIFLFVLLAFEVFVVIVIAVYS